MDQRTVRLIASVQEVLQKLQQINESEAPLSFKTYASSCQLASDGRNTIQELVGVFQGNTKLQEILGHLNTSIDEVADLLEQKHAHILSISVIDLTRDINKYMTSCTASMKNLQLLQRSNREYVNSTGNLSQMIKSLGEKVTSIQEKMSASVNTEGDKPTSQSIQKRKLVLREQWKDLSIVMEECLESMSLLIEQQRRVDVHDYGTPFRKAPGYSFSAQSFEHTKRKRTDEHERTKKQELGVFTLVAQSQANIKRALKAASEMRITSKGHSFGKKSVLETDEHIVKVLKKKRKVEREKRRKIDSTLRDKEAEPKGLSDINFDTVKTRAPAFSFIKAEEVDLASEVAPDDETISQRVRRLVRIKRKLKEERLGPGAYDPSFVAIEKTIPVPKIIPPAPEKSNKKEEKLGPGLYFIERSDAVVKPRVPIATTVQLREPTERRITEEEKKQIRLQEKRQKRKEKRNKRREENARGMSQADLWLRELQDRESEREGGSSSDDLGTDSSYDGTTHPAHLPAGAEYEPDPFAALSNKVSGRKRTVGGVILPEPSKEITVEKIRANMRQRRKVSKYQQRFMENEEKREAWLDLKEESERKLRLDREEQERKRNRDDLFQTKEHYQGPMLYPSDALVTPFSSKPVFKYKLSQKPVPSARRRWYIRKQKERVDELKGIIAEKDMRYELNRHNTEKLLSEPFHVMVGRDGLNAEANENKKQTIERDRRVYNPNYAFFDKRVQSFVNMEKSTSRFKPSQADYAKMLDDDVDGDVLILHPEKGKDYQQGHTWKQALLFEGEGGTLSDTEVDYREKRRRDHVKAKEQERLHAPVMSELDLSIDPRRKSVPKWDFGKLASRSFDDKSDPNLFYLNEDAHSAFYNPNVNATSNMGQSNKLVSFAQENRGLDKPIEKSNDARFALNLDAADAFVRKSNKANSFYKYSARHDIDHNYEDYEDDGKLLLYPDINVIKPNATKVNFASDTARFSAIDSDNDAPMVNLIHGNIATKSSTGIVSFGKQTGREAYDIRSGQNIDDNEYDMLLYPTKPHSVPNVVDYSRLTGRDDDDIMGHQYSTAIDGKDDRPFIGPDADKTLRKSVTGVLEFDKQTARDYQDKKDPSGELIDPHNMDIGYKNPTNIIFPKSPRFDSDQFDQEQTLLLFPSDEIQRKTPMLLSFSKAPKESSIPIQTSEELNHLDVQTAYESTKGESFKPNFSSSEPRFKHEDGLEANGDQFLLFPEKGDPIGKHGPQYSFQTSTRPLLSSSTGIEIQTVLDVPSAYNAANPTRPAPTFGNEHIIDTQPENEPSLYYPNIDATRKRIFSASIDHVPRSIPEVESPSRSSVYFTDRPTKKLTTTKSFHRRSKEKPEKKSVSIPSSQSPTDWSMNGWETMEDGESMDNLPISESDTEYHQRQSQEDEIPDKKVKQPKKQLRHSSSKDFFSLHTIPSKSLIQSSKRKEKKIQAVYQDNVYIAPQIRSPRLKRSGKAAKHYDKVQLLNSDILNQSNEYKAGSLQLPQELEEDLLLRNLEKKAQLFLHAKPQKPVPMTPRKSVRFASPDRIEQVRIISPLPSANNSKEDLFDEYSYSNYEGESDDADYLYM